MKKAAILLLIFMVMLIGCSGSDTYRGVWKAMDVRGEKFEIVFEAKRFLVKDSAGKTTEYTYSQNSVQIEGARAQYRIKLGDGRQYFVSFPNKKDETRGVIKDLDSNPIYTIGRNEFISNADLLKL